MLHRLVATITLTVAAAGLSAAGPGRSAAAAQGAQGPEVKIVTPRPDRPLSDPIVIQALVRSRDADPVVRVTAFVDDRELGPRTAPPYRWNVQRPPAATVQVRVVAVDSRGREGAAELLLTTNPTVRFEAEVPAVTMNLAALDEDDRFVADLEPQEITITDNGIEQTLLEFARTEAPLRVAILLDRSGSMEERMGFTLDALAEFLAQLGPEDQVKLMGFNDRVTSFTPFTAEHDVVAALSRLVEATGGTALFDAVVYGQRQLSSLQAATERRVIFLLTDGQDSVSRSGLHFVVDTLRSSGVTVFALGQGEALEDDQLRALLEEIVEATGGEAYFEDDPDRFPELFRRVALSMRALYLVAYRPTDDTQGWHQIQVTARRPGLRLRYKPGYERRDGR